MRDEDEEDEGLNKLGEIRNAETGEVLVKMFGPPNALTGEDLLAHGLYILSETLSRGLNQDGRGGLGGRFGYGVDYENEVFMMHHFCWCDKELCLWCIHGDHPDFERLLGEQFGNEDKSTPYQYSRHGNKGYYDAPNFWHKPTDTRISWYKWIGRDMGINRDSLTGLEWKDIILGCLNSLPKELRDKADASETEERAYKASAQYEVDQKRADEFQATMFQAMRDAHNTCEREGHDDATGHCKRCGLITDFERGFMAIHETDGRTSGV